MVKQFHLIEAFKLNGEQVEPPVQKHRLDRQYVLSWIRDMLLHLELKGAQQKLSFYTDFITYRIKKVLETIIYSAD